MKLLIFTFTFVQLILVNASLKWLVNLAGETSKWTREMCSMKRYDLTSKQRSTCRRNINEMYYASIAARDAINQCWLELSWDRWTCASLTQNITNGPDLATGTRGRAIVQAISASSLVWTFISHCATGRIHDCICPGAGVVGNIEFIQYQCDRNYDRGLHFAKDFLDMGKKKLKKTQSKSPEKAILVKMDEHNRQVGYRTLKQIKEKRCICPGNSGGCTQKVCYSYLPDFQKTVLELRRKHQEAVYVITNKKENTYVPAYDHEDVVSEDEFVYNDKVLDEKCIEEKTYRQYGFDNKCYLGDENPKYHDQDNRLCKDMCCDGKYVKEKVKVVGERNCTFKYCCEIECEHYTYYKDFHYCA